MGEPASVVDRSMGGSFEHTLIRPGIDASAETIPNTSAAVDIAGLHV